MGKMFAVGHMDYCAGGCANWFVALAIATTEERAEELRQQILKRLQEEGREEEGKETTYWELPVDRLPDEPRH